MGCRIPGSSRRSRCSIFWEGSFERWTRRPTVSFPANSGRRGTRAPTTAGWRRRASTSPRWTSWARHKPSAWCCSGNGGLNLGRGLWVGAALAVFVHAPLAFPSTAWAQSGPSPRSPGPSHEILTARAAREAARSRWLTARWSGTLAALREAQVRWDQASETYRSVLRTAPLPAASSRRRMDAWTSVALDLVENGEWARGLTLLRGPLASERSLVSIHALAAARLESPAAGLRVLGWPPDARSSFRAERPSARDEAQLYVAATLSDSAGSPRPAQAASGRRGRVRARERSRVSAVSRAPVRGLVRGIPRAPLATWRSFFGQPRGLGARSGPVASRASRFRGGRQQVRACRGIGQRGHDRGDRGLGARARMGRPTDAARGRDCPSMGAHADPHAIPCRSHAGSRGGRLDPRGLARVGRFHARGAGPRRRPRLLLARMGSVGPRRFIPRPAVLPASVGARPLVL